MTKFAPAQEDGLKPWVRTTYQWGRESHSLVYADTAAEARNMYRKMQYESVSARRATPNDVDMYSDE